MWVRLRDLERIVTRSPRTPFRTVAVEMRARAVVLVAIGILVVIVGVMHGVWQALIGAAAGMVFFGGLWWSQWRPLLHNSVVRARPAPSGIRLMTVKRTALVAAIRLAVIMIPLTVAIILVQVGSEAITPAGYGLIGGIWLIMGILLYSGSVWLRLWERGHGMIVLHEARRWSSSKNIRGYEAHSTKERSQGKRAWQYFTVPH